MYKIYDSKKNRIISSFFNSNTIEQPALLLTGRKGVGKKITAFHIAKNYLNLNSIDEVFYKKNVLYFMKDFPLNEYNILKKLYTSNEDKFLKDIYKRKLLFILKRFLSQFRYSITKLKKKLNNDDIDFLTSAYFEIKKKEITEKRFLEILDIVYKYIDYLKNNYIYMDEMSKLQKWIHNTSMFDKRIVLIEDIEKMSKEVANSFLKTLEEPPKGLIFILISENKFTILDTIKSRCIVQNIENVTDEEFELIISNEWNSSLLKFYKFDNFKRFFDVLSEEDQRGNLVEDCNKFMNLALSEKENYALVYKLIKKQKDLKEFVIDLIAAFTTYRESYVKEKLVKKNGITLLQFDNLKLFLEYLINVNSKLNYSLENGLIYFYLNRYRIVNGDFDGEKLFL